MNGIGILEKLQIVITITFFCVVQANAQQIDNVQELTMRDVSAERVKTCVRYLELLAAARQQNERENVDSYRSVIYTLFEGKQTRVYNDLVPPEVLQKYPSQEETYQLESYLTNMYTFYPDELSVVYTNFEVSDVFFDAAINRYFVKVVADRKINGRFMYKDEVTPYTDIKKIDFYLYATIDDGIAKVGHIYAADEHKDNTHTFTKVKVNRSSIEPSAFIKNRVSAPIKINPQTFKNAYKRGKKLTIEWEGGLPDEVIQVELIPKDTTKAKEIHTGFNTNRLNWSIPVNEKYGKNYQLKIKNMSQPGMSAVTHPFVIKRKVPLLLKIGGAVLVSAITAKILDELIDPPPPGDLEFPPDLPR